MTSAAVAVTISMWQSQLRIPFGLITAVFAYTTVLNVFERPEGLKIASFFIAATVITSLISRALRATELRITERTGDVLAALAEARTIAWRNADQLRMALKRP
jgi:hypothetical protein